MYLIRACNMDQVSVVGEQTLTGKIFQPLYSLVN